jgi:branched-chain amino acid transport system permease protein
MNGQAASAPLAVAWVPWVAYALLLAGAPLLWDSSQSLTLLSQMGVAIIACLAYNLLLGQGGMLSFGHAVYSGLGGFFAIHTLRWVEAGTLALPVSLVPLVGGAFGLLFAAVLGWVTTRKSGTTFAMITLGVGELVWAVSLMFPGFFGGEGGVSANRVVGEPVLGLTFGPALQVYGLIAVYTFVCTAALYGFTRTPLGRLLNAVRDNPERVDFLGVDPRVVRYLAFLTSGFFMGVAGGLAALNFEIVTTEVLGATRSGALLLFTVLGGTMVFYGPILGGVLLVLTTVMLSAVTQAWLLVLGLVFMLVVGVAPGGLGGGVASVAALAQARRLGPLAAGLLALAGLALACGAALLVLVEMFYHLKLQQVQGSALRFLGLGLDVAKADAWLGAAWLALTAGGLFELTRRRLAPQWRAAQVEAQQDAQRRRGPA